MTTTTRLARRSLAPLAVLAAVAGSLVGGGTASADGPLTVWTPYPTIETQPGSTVKLDLNVATTSTQAVQHALGGLLPDRLEATMRGGGFVVESVTATPTTPATATLEITVPTGGRARGLRDDDHRHRSGGHE